MTQSVPIAQYTHLSLTYKLNTEDSDGSKISSIYSNPPSSEDSVVVILDLTPSVWAHGVSPIKHDGNNRLYLQDMYNILIRFLKSYAYMSINNRCCIIGTHNSGCAILYEGVLFNDWLPSCYDGECLQDAIVEKTTRRIWNEIISFMELGLDNPSKDAQLTSAISMGLLYLNRIKLCNIGTGKRIIIIDVSSIDNYRSQYIGLMNIAFSASNLNITINVLSLGQPSGILEQLGAITNAKYLLLSNVFQAEAEVLKLDQSIFQLLTFWLLPSQETSRILSTQLPFEFINTGICYCHYKAVEIAFLCPCCFAVYCSEKDDHDKYRMICMVCGSRLIKQLIKKRLSSEADFSKN